MHDESLTHLDEAGRARMVDVSEKDATARRAVAEATVAMSQRLTDQVFSGGLPKGDAAAVVRVAAIMAAKETPRLIPLCHPIGIDGVEVTMERTETGARIQVTATTTAKTGIEMEAMTAAAVGALALYDMVKGLERGVEVGPVRLLHKSGGRTGTWER